MPLIVWTARKIAPTASAPRAPPARSSSSSEWLMAETCSRLSVRKSSAYWVLSMTAKAPSAEHALDSLEHSARLERLHHEVLGAGLDRFNHERLLPHGAAHEDARTRI